MLRGLNSLSACSVRIGRRIARRFCTTFNAAALMPPLATISVGG